MNRSSRNLTRSRRAFGSPLRVEWLEDRDLPSSTPLAAVLPVSNTSVNVAPVVPGAINSDAAWAGGSQSQSFTGLTRKPSDGSGLLAQIPIVVGWNQSPSPAGEGYTPAQMRQAYGFNQINLPTGQSFDDAGRGQTIAIIDPMNDPFIASDVQAFDQIFNISGAAHDPSSTSFLRVVNQNGGTTLPATDTGDYGLETSLDVEWAHAMAPGANILLVETDSFFSLNDIGTAIETAERQPGVSVISMSFGFSDSPSEYYLDNLFTTPAGHQGISFIASAGDNGGFDSEYPAMSPNVLSVGGTTLPTDAAGNPNRALDYAWNLGGGGISREAEPAFQSGVQSTGSRTGPDLAYDADQATGVAIIDTLYANRFFPGNPWMKIGGTSMGAPQMSSMVAITNQLRVNAGEGTIDGARQLLPAIYQIAATDPNAFQDITSGNNDYAAGPGYDFATGLGTPNARYLVPDLVSAYSTPPASRTLYWTGDVNTDWDTPGNWSTVDPAVSNVQQSVLPLAADRVVVDVSGATILHDTTRYDTISSFTVTSPRVTLDIGAGTIDLAGSSVRGTFRVDQNGDAVTIEAGALANAVVTSGTTLWTTSLDDRNYPELVAVQLDGTVNATQSGMNNGFLFQNGLILNGTVNLGGNRDQSSVIGAGYWEPDDGNEDNNPEILSGTGTIRLGQSQGADGLQTWGSLGTFTVGPNITIVGGGSGSKALFIQTNFTGGFDFQGTIRQNGGAMMIESFGPALYGWSSTTMGWTNEGTITATGALLGLLGTWSNSGRITVDSHSTLLLGDGTAGEHVGDPAAGYDAWSSTGTVTIADGATVYVGGFLTTDQYQGLAAIPGLIWHPTVDPRILVGTLDNSPAANPASHGVFNSASTPLTVDGGTILGGSISSGSKAQISFVNPIPDNFNLAGWYPTYSASGGWLENVANGGTISINVAYLMLTNVTNSGTISAISGGTLDFQKTWANTGTIKVDGTSILHLGSPAIVGYANTPPTLADGQAYAWNPQTIGAIQISDGATVGIGGLLTTDLFMAFPTLPGVHIHPAQDTYFLDGWLDNKPADNPITHGVLALTSATGPLNVAGGLISGGTITSTGTGALDFETIGGYPGFIRSALDGVTNNGTINVVYAFVFAEGTITNNGTMTTAGQFFMLPGGSFTNNSTVTITGGSDGFGSPVINNGNITVTNAGFTAFASTPAVVLTNNGSISLNASYLYTTGTINSGTVTAVNHGNVELEGNYDNSHGAVSVDSTSTLILGRGTLQQQNFPTFADGNAYAFDPSKVGNIQIADGATLYLGGLMTTDQMNAFPSLPSVSVHFARDRMVLWGWLDNSPADNPVSGGVLALNSATGRLFLLGGYIYHGVITTSGSNDLEASYVGILDGIELDGNLNVTGPSYFGEIYVENNMTLNGTIVMPGNQGFLYFGQYDAAPETLSGTGSISMGTSSSYESVVDNRSNTSLTIGSGITITAAAHLSYFVAERSQTNMLGMVADNTAGSTLYTYGDNFSTFTPFQSLANLNGGTLTGGTWEFSNGATWRTYGVDITTNAANLSISGAGTQVLDSVFDQGHNALAGLTSNAATGHLTIGPGYSLALHGSFLNAGILELGGTISVQGNYTQSAGAALNIDIAGPTSYGSLTVSGTATLAGTLNVALVNGYTPALGTSFAILTFGNRSGDFSTKNGLLFSPSEAFEADYLGNTLTLVAIP